MTPSWYKFAVITLGFAASAGLTVPARAQSANAVTRIATVPDGLLFYVDGTQYTHAISVAWPVGSKHTLQVTSGVQGTSQQNTQVTFNGWQWPGGTFAGNAIVITADTSITQYTASFLVQYTLTVNFFPCTTEPCNGPGKVVIDGITYDASTQLWIAAGATAILQAFPNPGYIFGGWLPQRDQVITGFQDKVTVNGPIQAYPSFQVARPINFTTVPAGFQVLADHTAFSTPGSQDWGWDSVHSLGAISPQYDMQGNPWIFSSWSDGGALNHSYTVGKSSLPDMVTATFVPGAPMTFVTSPPNLSLNIDGRSNWLSYNFTWGVGETHTFSAPAQQTDAQGHLWAFAGWSNGGPAAQSVTVPSSAVGQGIRFIATFTPVGHLTVNSSLAGVAVTVNGNSCAMPCDIQQAPGTQVTVSAPARMAVTKTSRQDFAGWSNGTGTGDLILTLGTDPVQVSANYHLMNYLAAQSNPTGGATWNYSPASADGFYDSQTTVNLSVTPLSGFRFRNWSGDLYGTTPAGAIAMATPRLVVAMLDTVPYLPAAAVNNAAGGTPVNGEAPGSVISIFGVNLAASTVVGPSDQLSQTLGGLTVKVGDRLLPLIFVSPSQINAQLPADVPTGRTVATVSMVGEPDVQSAFNVVPEAPGLFSQTVGGQAFAVAFHADGSAVSSTSPVQQGETIAVYGTGFGPTYPGRPEGLPVPVAPAVLMQDAITVQVGTVTLPVQNAYAVSGLVGVDAVAFTIDASVTAGAPAALTVTVNGQLSNPVILPLQ